jgi:cation:H+ antiporter
MSLALPLLILIFVGCAAAIWVAGIQLSNTTDVLSQRLGLGSALGGVILLAVATNLPEIAITATAALAHNLGIAIGNILGGIAIQTVVLVALDAFGVRGSRPLTYRAASLGLVLEAASVVAVLTVVIGGSRLPKDLEAFRLAPDSLLVTAIWILGLVLISRARRGLPWHSAEHPPGGQDRPRGHATQAKEASATQRGMSTVKAGAIFAAAAAVTLVAGIFLERSGDGIAGHIGLSGVLFGATVLAASTSLPELSTGLTSAKMGDYQLAVSDIFGGNAFLPVLFLLATLLSGSAAIPQAQNTDVYLTALAILLTVVYAVGLIFRPARRIARMGPDSLAVLVLYAIGIVGLVTIA